MLAANPAPQAPCVAPVSSRKVPPLICPPCTACRRPQCAWARRQHSARCARAAEGGLQPAAATSSGLFAERDTFREAPPAVRPPPAREERVGVLLLNLGGPDTLDDVQPFLYNLFADPDIIRLPAAIQFVQPAVAQLVSSLRTPKAREGYEAIGGGSPLLRITQDQAAALEEALVRKGLPSHVYVAMRYWKPFTGGRGRAGLGRRSRACEWGPKAGCTACWLAAVQVSTAPRGGGTAQEAAVRRRARCSQRYSAVWRGAPLDSNSPSPVWLPPARPVCRGCDRSGEERRHHAAGGAAALPAVLGVHQRLQPAPAGGAAQVGPHAEAGALEWPA